MTSGGNSPFPARQFAQPATVGQVILFEVEHHRRHQHDRRCAAVGVRVVVAQAVYALLAGDLERRRFLVGREAPEARDLERVLGRRAEPGRRSRHCLRDEVHGPRTSSPNAASRATSGRIDSVSCAASVSALGRQIVEPRMTDG